MAGVVAPGELLGALSALLDRLGRVEVPLETDGVEQARALRSSIVDQLSDYVVPRLVQLDAPMLIVVGGSTGAGKSTLVNSIVGEVVTESGVLRPTTRSPVLAHHPADADWFLPDRVLPDLARTDQPGNTTYGLRLRASESIPQGLALLDAPDIDSIDEGNRALATQLLAAADLWLFVTSAARYADQLPWEYLGQAAERSTSVAVVLDRTHPDGIAEVRGHLARMMTSRGLSDSPLFTVPEQPVDAQGLLPAEAVASIIEWLQDLAGDDRAKASIVRSTLDGAVRETVMRSHDLADAFDAQIAAADQLRTAVDQHFGASVSAIENRLSEGELISGELAAAWQNFVGSGELAAADTAKKGGRLRQRLRDGVGTKRSKADEVAAELERELAVLVVDRVESAAAATVADWAAVTAGEAIVAPRHGLDRAQRDVRPRAEKTLQEWRRQIIAEVESALHAADAGKKRSSIGANGLSVAVVVSAIGGEQTYAGKIAREVVDAVLDQQVASTVIAHASASVRDVTTGLVRQEQARFAALAADPLTVRELQSGIREAAQNVENARHLDALEAQLMPGTHAPGRAEGSQES